MHEAYEYDLHVMTKLEPQACIVFSCYPTFNIKIISVYFRQSFNFIYLSIHCRNAKAQRGSLSAYLEAYLVLFTFLLISKAEILGNLTHMVGSVPSLSMLF